MTPASRIAAAAALMRQRAEAATPGPWVAEDGIWHIEPDGQPRPVASRTNAPDAAYIAAMSPPVALAVADLLDAHADSHEATCPSDGCRNASPYQAALTVARTYLANEGDTHE